MKTLSIIVPCYNEEASLPVFYSEIKKTAAVLKKTAQLNCEILFVNDGSTDNTLALLRDFRERDARVQYLSFSRNFGKEAALFAGLEHVSGDYIAMMDADLQDPPELLIEMYRGISEEGFDCVATRRTTRRGEPRVRSFFARQFYKIINRMSNVEIVDGARDFRLMTRQMVNAILDVKEYNRFSKGIFSWVGFDTKWLEYENRERVAGDTKWSFWKLFLYSLDGIVAYSTAPLALASILGFLCCIISLVIIVFFVVKTLVWGDPVAGYPSMICIILMIGGIQLFSIGILGQYLSKNYLETKRRPIYILKENSRETKTP